MPLRMMANIQMCEPVNIASLSSQLAVFTMQLNGENLDNRGGKLICTQHFISVRRGKANKAEYDY